MNNLTKQQVEDIILVYDEIQTGNVNEENINEAFELLPEKNAGLNTLMKIRAINTYVIMNNEELINMKTTIVNNQSDQNEVVLPYALKDGVKPKRKYTKRKTKARRKR